jgi:asparagine synthase (glutamine-hydrolysing)
MCGITGILSAEPRPEYRQALEKMSAAIHHRGPDDSGHYLEADRVFLGHRRLSIIDLATGRQPIANEDGRKWIVYNGEVFNHAAVRKELETAGHRYRTRTDTETILHAWEEFGPDCLHRFRGMFAFAIWDADQQTLFCARDRLGIKPFYYFLSDGLFLFASEIKALLEHPALTPVLDTDVLPEYLAFGYPSGERTMFRGIRKLMPGHRMTVAVRDGRIVCQIEQYWDPLDRAGEQSRDESECVAEFRRRLEETVEMRLMSDVPLGVFLSGGLDSSAIAALARRMLDGRLQTFSVGYAEAKFSELDYARKAAAFIGAEHHEVRLGMEGFFNLLPRLVWHEDEPIAWPSSVALYSVGRLASEHVKVVLTGEGSDELYAGYGRYTNYLWNLRWLPCYRWLPESVKAGIRAEIERSRWISADLRRKLLHTFVGRNGDVRSLLLDNFYSAFDEPSITAIVKHPGAPPYANYLQYFESAGGRLHPLQQLLYADQKTYLVELLMKQDQMSMACSIESRVPLLDHTFVEFSYRVPPSLKLPRSGKYVVKKAVEDLLPPEIIYRKKQGFPTPLKQWLLDPKCQPLFRAMLNPNGLLADFLHLEPLGTMMERHLSRQIDATDRIWRLLNLHVWGQVFLCRRYGPPSLDALMPLPAGAAR